MTEPTPTPAPLAPDSGMKRDDFRPLGSPHAGIAPGQLDEAAVLDATEDAAGEPIPPADVMRDRGLGVAATPDMPKASHDTTDDGKIHE
ncbi:hypothetical protein [Sandarakinorhabdus sp. DWP1-3-1]|uniref:hypothetical protein n=1 Tax=Sandarakinorhabdus sp. DWP1-3-1 TaxID=2804627 RepID=UPI003CEFAE06